MKNRLRKAIKCYVTLHIFFFFGFVFKITSADVGFFFLTASRNYYYFINLILLLFIEDLVEDCFSFNKSRLCCRISASRKDEQILIGRNI